MTKSRGKIKTRTKRKTKTKPKSLVKRRRRGRNPRGDQPLSFDLPAKDDMSKQTGAPPKQRVHDSINLVLAECDKVDAVLIEITRDHEMPPLAIKEVEPANGGGGPKRGWAVVSADPQKPLTERQAKEILAAILASAYSGSVGENALRCSWRSLVLSSPVAGDTAAPPH